MPKKTFYYTDPVNDDFAGNNIKTTVVDKDFPFARDSENIFYRIAAFLAYYLIAWPIVWCISKLYLGLRIENRKALRKVKGGFFLYGNHTRALDAFVPPLVSWPKKAFTIANPDAVSLPFLRHFVLMIGGLPIPTTLSAMPVFLHTVEHRCAQGSCIAIYPEAHIWPFYTGIRPFPATSFRYPVVMNRPALAMVTTYRKRKGLMFWCRRPGMTVTVSEPFFADPSLPRRQAQEKLRNEIHDYMERVSAAKGSVVYYEYLPKSGQAG